MARFERIAAASRERCSLLMITARRKRRTTRSTERKLTEVSTSSGMSARMKAMVTTTMSMTCITSKKKEEPKAKMRTEISTRKTERKTRSSVYSQSRGSTLSHSTVSVALREISRVVAAMHSGSSTSSQLSAVVRSMKMMTAYTSTRKITRISKESRLSVSRRLRRRFCRPEYSGW